MLIHSIAVFDCDDTKMVVKKESTANYRAELKTEVTYLENVAASSKTKLHPHQKYAVGLMGEGKRLVIKHHILGVCNATGQPNKATLNKTHDHELTNIQTKSIVHGKNCRAVALGLL